MTELKSQIEELVGPAIQVNDEVIRACQERNEFGGLSFALFKEAAVGSDGNSGHQTFQAASNPA